MSSLLVVLDLAGNKRDVFGIITGEDPKQIRSQVTQDNITQYGYQRQYGNWPDIYLVIVRSDINNQPGAHLTPEGILEITVMRKMEKVIEGFCQNIQHDGLLTICKFVSKAELFVPPTTLDWLQDSPPEV